MRILKAIIISSLSIPVLVFVIFSGVGLVFLVAMFAQEGGYNKGWLGMVYAGAVYSYFAVLVSSIPTFVIGYPVSLLAEKYGLLKRWVVLMGAAILGGLFLCISSSVVIEATDAQLLLWAFCIGAVGGMFNGYIFSKYMKPNNRLQDDAAPPRA